MIDVNKVFSSLSLFVLMTLATVHAQSLLGGGKKQSIILEQVHLNNNSVFSFTNVQLSQRPGDSSVFSFDMDVSKSTGAFQKVEFELNKSKDRRSPFQYFNTLRIVGEKTICQFLKTKNMLWTPFVDSIRPEVKCTLDKAQYKCRNGTIDLKQVQAMNLPTDGFWKVFVRFYFKDAAVVASIMGYLADKNTPRPRP